MSRFRDFVFLLVLALNCGRAYVPQKINLTVYYESKCPDSRDFIVEQLQPAMDFFQGYIALKMIPFGKATSINHGYNGFECQHGPKECLGNMVQDCALNAMANRSDEEKVAYVMCEMETKSGTEGNLRCVRQTNISEKEVEQCIFSGLGIELQLNSEYFTKLLSPKFIPTITINGIFNQNVQDSAQEDLIGTICNLFKDKLPCAQHYNDIPMGSLYQ